MVGAEQKDLKLLENIKKYVLENYIEENDDYQVSDASLFGVDLKEKSSVKFSVFDDFEGLLNLKNRNDETWQQAVFYLIDKKEYSDPEVYKRASISKQTFSKIRCDINYQPNKDTAIQMCIGLKLNIDETVDLMCKAGYTLSSSIKRDLVVKYFIEQKIYKMDDLNIVLDDMDLKLFPIN